MEKLFLGLTCEAIDELFKNLFGYNNAKNRISQHKILMSPWLQKEYAKYFSNNIALFRQWFYVFKNNMKYCTDDSIGDDQSFIDYLLSLVSQHRYRIVVCKDKTSIMQHGFSLISLSDLNNTYSSDIITEHCIPRQWTIQKDDECNHYFEILKDFFENETDIKIVDRHILKHANIDLINRFLIPSFPNCVKIHFYYAEGPESANVIQQLRTRWSSRLVFHPSKPRSFHGRNIRCNTLFVTMDNSLDVFILNNATMKIKMDDATTFTISSDISQCPTLPRPR